MVSRQILIVDDNPITCKLTRLTLESAGYTVLIAPDGQSALAAAAAHRPDLILQDLRLPDMDGIALMTQLRTVPGSAERPILAFSGAENDLEEARTAAPGFADYLVKPIEPARLLAIIEAYLPSHPDDTHPRAGQRILIADDDPLQRKLLAVHLEQAGYQVVAVADGAEALDQARRAPPDAVISDVLMPRLDGFRLCQALRHDPTLAAIPVILISADYTEEADHTLAADVGASALLPRTPDLHPVIAHLGAQLGAALRPSAAEDTVAATYTERVVHQLERQAQLNRGLRDHVTWLEAQSIILSQLSEILRERAGDEALAEVLHVCLNASGLSKGAIFLCTEDGRVALRAHLGYPEAIAARLSDFFGHPARLRSVLEQDTMSTVVRSRHDDTLDARILERSGDEAMLLVPLALGQERLGVLVVASSDPDLYAKWGGFIAALAQHISQAIVLARTLTDLVSSQEQLHRAIETTAFQAVHDALTGLPNRTYFERQVQEALRHLHQDRQSFALLLLDLDRFKELNDTFGHHYGDLLLVQVGQRLQTVLPESERVARLGGDEFAVIVSPGTLAAAAQTARLIVRACEEPFLVEGQVLYVGCSIGIVLAPDHGSEAALLLRRADVAMYVAKRSHSGYAVYNAAQDQYSPDRLALVGDLRQALDHHELVLHYQPKVDLTGGQTVGAEALVRWQHPRHGMVPPDQFIPAAEQTGMIAPLTRWVLEAALHQGWQWHRAGHALSLSINISMWTLHDPQFVDMLSDVLQRYPLPAAAVCLELTESTVMADVVRTLEVLARLNARGIALAVDDFGTGYSSLAYLKRLPVSELKIDKSFVLHMTEDETDAAIVRSTVDLAHSLGLRVVAEGVETPAVRDALVHLGCDAAQGYYWSRPLPAAQFSRWLGQAL